MDFLHLLILFGLSIFFILLRFLDFLNRFWTFWKKWTKNWFDSIFWSFGCESFCPYRAYCWLLLYPGRCPGLGASAPSGRFILASVPSDSIAGSDKQRQKVANAFFTFLPFYLFTFYILNVKNITYFKYYIANLYFFRFIFVSLQRKMNK